MTAEHDAEFADVDACICRQLSEAAATLVADTDMQARLQEVLRAADRDTQRNEADADLGG